MNSYILSPGLAVCLLLCFSRQVIPSMVVRSVSRFQLCIMFHSNPALSLLTFCIFGSNRYNRNLYHHHRLQKIRNKTKRQQKTAEESVVALIFSKRCVLLNYFSVSSKKSFSKGKRIQCYIITLCNLFFFKIFSPISN